MRNKDGRFLFEDMLAITQSMPEKIHLSMSSIFEHLQTHQEWHKVLAIENQTVVGRQDDDRVGLLHDQGCGTLWTAKNRTPMSMTCRC